MVNEARWTALAEVVGDDDARLNKALGDAMTAFQGRFGYLPDGYDDESQNDLYGLALAAYAAL